MDSSYPSSPVTGPYFRGVRRASEVSIASQVSGMADSYTATSIANSKFSCYHKYLSRPPFLSLSLFLPLTQTLVLIAVRLSLYQSVLSFLYFLLSFSRSLHSEFSLPSPFSLTLSPRLTLHTPCTPTGAPQSASSTWAPYSPAR